MSPEELGRLVDKHGTALVLYAHQWCSSPEDIVQDAFFKLVRQKTSPLDAVSWLYRVVRNAAISALRAQKRRQRHESVAGKSASPWFISSTDGPDVDAATKALKALPVDQREIIVAHLWGGLTFASIAELIGTSSSSAHRSYVDGLNKLRERLSESCSNRPETQT